MKYPNLLPIAELRRRLKRDVRRKVKGSDMPAVLEYLNTYGLAFDNRGFAKVTVNNKVESHVAALRRAFSIMAAVERRQLSEAQAKAILTALQAQMDAWDKKTFPHTFQLP